jgi:hypothetical protein
MRRVFPSSKPPDGGYPPSFRLLVGGTQLRGSWYLSAIVRLQGFSSCSPVASPHWWSPKTVTASSWVGRSKPGCDLGPTLSFKDVHHPRWGGGRAEPVLYLPRRFAGHPFPRCSRERALTGPAGSADLDNVGLIDGGRRHLQRVGVVGLAPGGPLPEGGCRAVCTGGPPTTPRAARAAFVFWGGPAFAPGWRLRAEADAPLVWEDLSGDLPGGWWPSPSAPRRRRLEKSPSPTGSLPPSAPRASGSSYLSSPLERRRGRGQDCSSAHPEACTAAARPSGAGVVVVVVRAGGGEPLVSLLLLRRPSPWSGVVRTCGGGTGVPFVMALRMPVFLFIVAVEA